MLKHTRKLGKLESLSIYRLYLNSLNICELNITILLCTLMSHIHTLTHTHTRTHLHTRIHIHNIYLFIYSVYIFMYLCICVYM